MLINRMNALMLLCVTGILIQVRKRSFVQQLLNRRKSVLFELQKGIAMIKSMAIHLRNHAHRVGHEFVEQVKALGIKQVLSAPRSPWQRAYVERLIGSLRRECLDHMIVFGDRALHRTLTAYASYYHSWRTHLALGKDSPQSRRIQGRAEGNIVEIREVGDLHHHYERRAA